jgi:O-antigen ligase
MQYFDLSEITEMRNVSYDHDIRFNIWGSALQHPTDYLWCGLGAGQSSTYLANQYHHVGFEYYALKRYHPHNQYLEELMEIGVFGMILFILAWLSISFYSKERGRHTAILFTTLFMLNMFTDCMFGKFCGIALWAVGLMFILLQSNSQCNEQTAGNTQTH